MICPDCRSPGRPDSRFCPQCGASLARSCSGCGAELLHEAKFCDRCGTPWTPPGDPAAEVASTPPGSSRPPSAPRDPRKPTKSVGRSTASLEGERRQVTVLFADVKGSMELAEQLDAEVWSEIMQRFFGILSEGVERFEGYVDKFTGDGIMALFGAPVAREDHAQRACYAALHLRNTLGAYADELRRTQGLSLATRIGINSGEVVVGTIGDDQRMDYTAQGHTVGLAQRMEQTAAPDTTYLTAHTARLVEGYFQLRDLGDFTLKGVGAPLRVHELQGIGALRTRLDSSRARGFSRFVGRDEEMAALRAALDRAVAGHGQVVGVVADAGTGKSRLCREFVEHCRSRGIRVNEAHCPAHGKTVPYLPLLEMLRDMFGVEDQDSDREARRKIAGELVLLDDSFRDLLPILFEFMGVADPAKPAPPMGPEARQQRLFALVRDLVRARSVDEPSVLFVDDLHWIDGASDAFLAHSVEAADQTRTLWLVNFRPEYHAEWMSRPFYQSLSLRPLGPEEIATLLADLLGSDPSIGALPTRIHERSGGNPFFVEEIVQSLVEAGSLEGRKGAYRLVTDAEALQIPSTVQSVLAARIDRLPPHAKRLLQTASVIGKEFPAPLLQAVVARDRRDARSEEGLAASISVLAGGEFLFERALYPEVEYAFKHPLTQEVAYRSLLANRRAELHGAVASAIEQLDAEKLDARAALLAYHWELAGEPLVAATWHAHAAGIAGFDSPVEAVRHWEKAWEILQSVADSEASVALRRRAAPQLLLFAWRLGMNRERVDEVFAEGKALAVAAQDLAEQIRLHYSLGLVHSLSGDPRTSFPIFEEAVVLADGSGDPELRWSARTAYDFSLWLAGDLHAALEMTDEQLALAEANPALGLATVGISTADTYWHRATILADLGRLEEAQESLRGAQERVQRFDDHEMVGWLEFWKARVLERRGDVAGAMAMGRRAIESNEKIGSALGRTIAYGQYGAACALAGEWEAARESLEHAIRLGRDSRTCRFLESYDLAALAEAQWNLGEGALARTSVDSSIAFAERGQMRVAQVRGQLARARLLLALEGADAGEEVERALDRAAALVGETGARYFEPLIHVERSHLAGMRADAATRAGLLRQAHRLFTEMGAAGHAERVGTLLAGSRPG